MVLKNKHNKKMKRFEGKTKDIKNNNTINQNKVSPMSQTKNDSKRETFFINY
jgi:hypothetical protein